MAFILRKDNTPERQRQRALYSSDIDAAEAKRSLINGFVLVAASRIEAALRIIKQDSTIEVKPTFEEVTLALKEYKDLREKESSTNEI